MTYDTFSRDAAPQRPLTDQEALEAIADYDCDLSDHLQALGVTDQDLLRVVSAVERRHGIRG
jgi:hypothetical protein